MLVGHGRVGSLVGRALTEAGRSFLVVEDTDRTGADLRRDGVETIVGNAAEPSVLAAAAPARADCLVLAIPDAFEAGQVVEQARAANPKLHIVARAHSDAEVEHLTKLGADVVIMGEREIARAMIAEIETRTADAASSAPEAGPA